MISWLRNRSAKRKHDKVCRQYRDIATAIGDGLDALGLGDPWIRLRGKMMSIRDPEIYHILDEVEEAYASLGYRIIPLDHWIDYAGWGVSIDEFWLVKREEGERPQFTKLEPKRDLPEKSHLVDLVWETGKAHEAYRDENGDMQYRQVEE